MDEAKSIESLSLFFTAGVAAGTVSAGHHAATVCAVLLPLAALPFFCREKLLKQSPKAIGVLFCAAFLVLGLFCALNSSMIPKGSESLLFIKAEECAAALKALNALEQESGRKPAIALEAFKSFYPAEEYHQDYYLKNPEAFSKELEESGRNAYFKN